MSSKRGGRWSWESYKQRICPIRSPPPPSVWWAGLWRRTASVDCSEVSSQGWSKWPRPVQSWSAPTNSEKPFSANTTRRGYSGRCRPATPETALWPLWYYSRGRKGSFCQSKKHKQKWWTAQPISALKIYIKFSLFVFKMIFYNICSLLQILCAQLKIDHVLSVSSVLQSHAFWCAEQPADGSHSFVNNMWYVSL